MNKPKKVDLLLLADVAVDLRLRLIRTQMQMAKFTLVFVRASIEKYVQIPSRCETLTMYSNDSLLINIRHRNMQIDEL